MDVFTSRCNNAKMMVTTRKQCARARDVHESGKTSNSRPCSPFNPGKTPGPVHLDFIRDVD
jgi:hypothetical protein